MVSEIEEWPNGGMCWCELCGHKAFALPGRVLQYQRHFDGAGLCSHELHWKRFDNETEQAVAMKQRRAANG